MKIPKVPKIIKAASVVIDIISERNKEKNEKEHKRVAKENKAAFEKAWLEKYHGGVKPAHWDFDEDEV